MARPIGRPSLTVGSALLRGVDLAVHKHGGVGWPSPKWRNDPVGFARTILGVELWSFQVELLEAIRDNRHVAVAGGRKIGKDFAVACAALWWYCSFPRARVLLLAPKIAHVDEVAYREIRILKAHSGRCVDCVRANTESPCPHSAIITGAEGLSCKTGIKSADFREIIGHTAVHEGGLRGLSGSSILAIEDEASDIKDEFDAALIGNLASGDCRRVIISNPTRTQGFFHRAFHEERAIYRTLQVSSEESPNIREGREVHRGLAGSLWIAEREAAWGRGSPMWITNVDGQFLKSEEGQLFSLAAITDAERRWEESPSEGRLQIGVDVAGASYEGDETAFAVRRGQRVLELYATRGLTPDGILEHVRGLIRKYGRGEGQDEPKVVVDRDGPTGARVYDCVNAYRRRNETTEREFYLVGFRGGDPPIGALGDIYRYTRDALFGGLVDAFREGLTIPTDLKLEGELAAIRWADSDRGKSRLCAKSDLKDRLGRSPDRLDALALCTWGNSVPQWRAVAPPPARPLPPPVEPALRGLDAYGGAIDPYGGAMDPYR